MMTISEAQSVLHCPNAYGGIYGKKYGQALEVAFRCMEACEGSMTVEEYRQRMIQAFHNADCDSLIAIVSLPSEKEFEHLEWLLQTHYKKEPCEDCISRQAVVDWLTERTEKYDEKGHFISKELVKAEVKNWLAELPSVTPANVYVKGYKDAMEMHKKLKVEHKGKWISPKIALPEEDSFVLVTINARGRRRVRSSFYMNKLFMNDNGDTWRITDKHLVAWMYSPEPCGAETELKTNSREGE